MISGFRRELD